MIWLSNSLTVSGKQIA